MASNTTIPSCNENEKDKDKLPLTEEEIKDIEEHTCVGCGVVCIVKPKEDFFGDAMCESCYNPYEEEIYNVYVEGGGEDGGDEAVERWYEENGHKI